MDQFVTHRTRPSSPPADAARERLRLWASQRLVAASWAAAAIGLAWLAVVLGGGAVIAAGVVAAGVAPLALGAPLASRLAAHVRRRTLLWAAPAAAAAALAVCDLVAVRSGPAAAIACAAAVGTCRAVFDAATADALLHLTDPARRRDACADLTARFGAGHAAGVGAALVLGLAAGPRAIVLLAAGLAGAGALVAARHHRDLDLRVPQAPPGHAALLAGTRAAVRSAELRRALAGGGWATAVGAAQGAVLIAWLVRGVGLRGALVPALLAGFVTVALARPAIVGLAARLRPRPALAAVLAVQATASLAAHTADGSVGAAASYALGLSAALAIGAVATGALRAGAPPELAPAVGLAAGAAWALAACAGAALAAGLVAALGLPGTHLALAALALAGALTLGGREAAGAHLAGRRTAA